MPASAGIANVDRNLVPPAARRGTEIRRLHRWIAVAIGGLLCAVRSTAWGQEVRTDQEAGTDSNEATEVGQDEWIDRAHAGVHALVWRSARYVDGLFGSQLDPQVYEQQTRGSITPALLWDEFGGLDSKFRFRVKLPLPYLDQRYDAFIGTFSRDEFVTERELESGSIQRQHVGGRVEEDETLVGIQYRPPKEGGRFDAAAGLRIKSPIDPFVKVAYRYERGSTDRILFRWKETAFWEASEHFGLTSRVDLERIVGDAWLARWTISGTFSEKSDGLRGYTALTAYRGLPNRRGIGYQIFTSGSADDVPIDEYGIRVAWRQSIVRDWLIVEVRPSVTWPKDQPEQPRKPSWGLGIGFEMFFGTDEFQARPATF